MAQVCLPEGFSLPGELLSLLQSERLPHAVALQSAGRDMREGCARLIEQLQIGVLPDGGNHLIQKESARVVDPRFQVLIKQKIGGTLWRWVFRDGTAA